MKSFVDYRLEKIYISKDLIPLFDFIKVMQNELDVLIKLQDRLDEIKQVYITSLELNAFLCSKIDNADTILAGFEKWRTLSKNINNKEFIDKFFHITISRPEFLTLFSYLDVIISLYVSYNNQTRDDKFIIEKSKDEKRKFIAKYLLNKKNNFYFAKNSKRLWNISPKDIINCRNSLVHFYSPKDIAIKDNRHNFDHETLKSVKSNNLKVLDSNDLLNLIESWFLHFIKELSEDKDKDFEKFNSKLKFVLDIIDNESAKIVSAKAIISK